MTFMRCWMPAGIILSRPDGRLTFEYSLVGGVNDTEEDARELARLLDRRYQLPCKSDSGQPDQGAEIMCSQTSAVIEAFKNKLEKNGINVTIRREMGRDINGACGQLRKKLYG